ncbi:hypothetical protein [Phycicoccus flavus]|uniref:hypothetical protein n=1 Tax=Phycicoccus flavus TaxID=2502783 RepID=UPI000FEBBA36|nr:hypothetical protein [Phycicoccus flavus]NHA68828.1 hypothetical protein [Phycicoccus flavus]
MSVIRSVRGIRGVVSGSPVSRGAAPSGTGRRRTVVRGVLAAGALAAVVGMPAAPALAACPTGDQCTALPNVDAQRVMLASTIDPYRTDSATTAHDHVLRVERALVAKGFLASQWADGYWGTTTTAAWASFERSIGQDAVHTRNGIPSPWELRQIGKNRFDVVKSYDVGSRVTLKSVAAGGVSNDGTDVVNERTRSMFHEARRLMKSRGQSGWAMVVTQGGYCGSGCASTSYGTHDGGGIIDVRIVDTSSQTVIGNRLKALRDVGFAAWQRSNHIHAVAVNDYQMAWTVHGDTTPPAAVLDQGYPRGYCQVYEWKFRADGLGNCDDRVPSSAPSRTVTTWEGYLAARG